MKVKKNIILFFYLVVVLFVSCSGAKKVSINDCKKQTEIMLNSIKNGDYKTLLMIINSDRNIKERKISQVDLQLHFNSLNTYLDKYSMSDFIFIDSKDQTVKNFTFTKTVEVKNKNSNITILECLYLNGRNGDYYELDKFYNLLDTITTKASSLPAPPR